MGAIIGLETRVKHDSRHSWMPVAETYKLVTETSPDLTIPQTAGPLRAGTMSKQ
jgi:hypothetical protein